MVEKFWEAVWGFLLLSIMLMFVVRTGQYALRIPSEFGEVVDPMVQQEISRSQGMISLDEMRDWCADWNRSRSIEVGPR